MIKPDKNEFVKFFLLIFLKDFSTAIDRVIDRIIVPL